MNLHKLGIVHVCQSSLASNIDDQKSFDFGCEIPDALVKDAVNVLDRDIKERFIGGLLKFFRFGELTKRFS